MTFRAPAPSSAMPPQYDPDKGIADDLDGLERLKAR